MNEEREIPGGWVIAKLGSVCFTTSGGTPSRKILSYYQGSIPWVKSGELDKGLITKTEETISEEAIKNSSAKIFPKGTLLIALYGATIGKLGFLGVDAATNQAICGIFKNEIVDLHFLKYFLYNRRNKLVEQGTGGAQPNISQTILKDLEIPIPPLAEQHRIVAKIEELFSSLDKGIESLKTAQEQLKVYRQAVLKWAFEGRFGFSQRPRKSWKEGELPGGWEWKRIIDISNVNPKLPFENIPDDLEVSFLPMKLVEEVVNKINLIEFRKYGQVKKGFTPMTDGDVIFAKITPCMENGKIAVVHSLKNKIAFGSTEFHVLRCKQGYFNSYLFYFLVQERIRQKAEQSMTGAVGQRRVPKKFLEELEVPFPPTPSEQQFIVSEIEKRLSVCDKIEESIATSLQQAESLRQSILKKAFEGKLVPQDPNDEPASALLKRIKAQREKQSSAQRNIKRRKASKSAAH
ncbi:MAG: restriction endonuclease subunit S [Chitinophagaceae bacterium]|nr:restriction endonuclease subunit S [Chitinophagaceae bacterium]